jgi:hypothetical protein
VPRRRGKSSRLAVSRLKPSILTRRALAHPQNDIQTRSSSLLKIGLALPIFRPQAVPLCGVERADRFWTLSARKGILRGPQVAPTKSQPCRRATATWGPCLRPSSPPAQSAHSLGIIYKSTLNVKSAFPNFFTSLVSSQSPTPTRVAEVSRRSSAATPPLAPPRKNERGKFTFPLSPEMNTQMFN